jgi:SnoaL-like domain
MDFSERMEVIEAVRQLKARYFYCLDMKDWAGWGQVFAEHAVMDVSAEFANAPDPSANIFRGRERIVAAVSAAVGATVTIHQGYMPLIEVQASDTATGIWGMEDNLFFPDGRYLHGYGHYREKYLQLNGRWYIEHTVLSRLRTTMTPARS